MSAAASSSSKAAQDAAKLPACGFSVHGGKNGNLPIKVEKRPKGKKVTVISNVQGSAKALLSALSSLLGCGGTLRQESSGQHWTLEVQGEQTDRVSAALTQLGCLRGVKKDVEAREKKKTVDVATRVCAYDKFLKRGEPDKSEAKDNSEFAYATVPLPGAECTLWHGPWIYCRGNCQRSDLADVWEESLAGGSEAMVCQPCKPSSTEVELNLALQSLGMLAEIGHAVRGALTSMGGRAALTIGQYRRAALAPGAHFIDEEPAAGGSKARAKSRAASRARSRPRGEEEPAFVGARGRSRSSAPLRPAPPPVRLRPPPKIGNFGCPYCGCTFGLHKTLKLHLRTVHNDSSAQAVKPGAAPAFGLSGRIPGAPPPGQESVSLIGRWGPGHTAESAALARAWAAPRTPEGAAAPPPALTPRPASARASSRAASRSRPPPDASARGQPQRTWHQRSGGGRGGAEEVDECPVCLERIPKKSMEEHVEECFALASSAYARKGEQGRGGKSQQATTVAPALSDGAAASPAAGGRREERAAKQDRGGEDGIAEVFRVQEDYDPSDSTQIAVRQGMEVIVRWKQPKEEGAYWAWVQLPANGHILGYVPLHCLSRMQSPSMTPPRAAAAPEAGEDAGREAARAEGSQEEPRAIPEDWLSLFLEMNLTEDRATAFWENFEQLRNKGLSLEVAWLTALNRINGGPIAPALTDSGLAAGSEDKGGEEAELRASAGPRRPELASPSSLGSDRADDWLPVGDVCGVELFGYVATPWEAQDSIQLTVRGGEKFRVSWVQPPEEGGFWVYGSHEGPARGDGRCWGYIPRLVLVPATGAATAGGGGSSGSRAAGASVSARAGSPTATAGAAVTGSRATNAQATADQATAAAQAAAQQAAAQQAAAAQAAAAQAAAQQAAAVTAAAGQGAGQVGGRWRSGRRAAQGMQSALPPEEAHAELCNGVREAGLAPEDRKWVDSELNRLTERFCISRIDPDVVYSALASCESQTQMRQEATTLLADNEVVKNFAARLWSKRQQHHRGAGAGFRGREN